MITDFAVVTGAHARAGYALANTLRSVLDRTGPGKELDAEQSLRAIRHAIRAYERAIDAATPSHPSLNGATPWTKKNGPRA